MIASRATLGAALLILGMISPANGHPAEAPGNATTQKPDASLQAPSAAVDAFHAALGRGDTASAAALLADDAIIFESGDVERSKAEYAAHHLGADATFAQAVPRTLRSRSGAVLGDSAWIASEARTTGIYRDRPIDSYLTETMVLRDGPGGWKIVHIHWSSAKAK